MPSVETAKKKYPETSFRPILITEVTKMYGNHYCVAAWDLYKAEIVRPLLPGGEYWQANTAQPRWHPGLLLNVVTTNVAFGLHPHRRENLILHERPVILESWQEPELYQSLFGTTHSSVVEAFGQPLLENKYVPEGTQCPSLGSIRIKRKNVKFMEDGFGRLRLRFRFSDNNADLYVLPVTSDFLLEMFSPKEGMFGVAEANEWLEVNELTQEIILRLGFARGWEGKDTEPYNPKRCYLQLNGIICPTDNLHIFDGPPLSNRIHV